MKSVGRLGRALRAQVCRVLSININVTTTSKTKKQLQQELEALGVSYRSKATNAELQALIAEHSPVADDSSALTTTEGFDLAAECGGGDLVEVQSGVDCNLLLGPADKYEGYVPSIGIHEMLGDGKCRPNPAEFPNQLEDVIFTDVKVEDVPFNGQERLKLNVYFQTRSGKILKATTGLNTFTSKGILAAIKFLEYNPILRDQPFTFSLKQGRVPTVWLPNCVFNNGTRAFFDNTFNAQVANADDPIEFLKAEVEDMRKFVFGGCVRSTVVEELRSLPAAK